MAEESSNFQERYMALMQAAKGLISCTTLDSIVENLLRHSIKMLQTETCSMLLPDWHKKELVIYSALGEQDRAVHTQRIPWDKGIAGYVFHEKKSVCIDDVQNDPRFLRVLDQRTGFVTRAMICHPLLEDDQCLGVVQALNPLFSPTFTELDQEIFKGLAGMITSALVRLENQKLREDEARRLSEMDLARDIQRSYLPPDKSILPRAEVNVHYKSARTVGGDFYAVIPLSQNAVIFALGDVSGKGVPAALTTAQVMGELNALATHSAKNLSSLVRTLNQHLCARLSAGRFVATTFLLYEPELNEIEIISAGQFAPWRWDGYHWSHLDIPAALPLGVLENYPYTSTKIKTLPGERWLLCSDGINEGRDSENQEYGLDRLLASLGTGISQDVLHRAWDTWCQFVELDDLHDDACLGMLSCTPPTTLKVLSGAQNCRVIRAFIESWGLHAGLTDLERGEIVLAMDEAFTNVLRHAYDNEPGHPVDLIATLDEKNLCFKLRDYGKPFPDDIPERDLQVIRPGGFGVPILHKIFCSVDFLPQDKGTELTLIKTLNEASKKEPSQS